MRLASLAVQHHGAEFGHAELPDDTTAQVNIKGAIEGGGVAYATPQLFVAVRNRREAAVVFVVMKLVVVRTSIRDAREAQRAHRRDDVGGLRA